MKNLVFVLFFTSFCAAAQNGDTTFVWAKNYLIDIKNNENRDSLSLTVLEKTSKNIIFRDSIFSVGNFFSWQETAFFSTHIILFYHHSGGEGIAQLSLLILFENKGIITAQAFEQEVIDAELADLNKDSIPELILNDYTYYKLNLNGCDKKLEPDPYFSGKMMPRVLEFKNGRFEKIKDELWLEMMLRSYARRLSVTFSNKRPPPDDVLAYTHFYVVCVSADIEIVFGDFMKKYNPTIIYECSDNKSFIIRMLGSEFFKQYGEQILFGE